MGTGVRRRFNRAVLVSVAVMLPLAFWPPFEDAFKLPQTTVVVFAGMWALLVIRKPDVSPVPGWLWPGLAVAAVSVASFAAHGSDSTPVELVRTACFVLVALAARSVLGTGGRGRPMLAEAMAAAGAMAAAYSLVQFFVADIAGGMATKGLRPFSTMGNPDFLAAYLVAVLPFAAWRAIAGGSRAWAGAAVVTGVAILVAQSRGAWLGMGAAAVAAPVLWRAGGGGPVPWRRLAVGIAVAAALTTGFLAVHQQGRARAAAMFSTGHFDAAGRLMMWRATMLMVRDHAILGTGPGAYPRLYPRYHARLMEEDPRRPWFFTENAHNDTLQIASDFGVVGLGIHIWLLAVLFRLGWQAHRSGYSAAFPILLGLVALVVDAQLNFPWYLVPVHGWVWLSLALFASRLPAPSSEAPCGTRPWALAAVAVVCMVLAAAWSRDLGANAWLKLSGDFAASGDPGKWPRVRVCAERSAARWTAWEGRGRPAAQAALAAYSLDDLPAAEAWSRVALADAPALPAHWNQLALAVARQGRLAEGEAACREALRLNPRLAEGWHALGNIAYLGGDRAGAASAWKRALTEEPGLAGARQSLEGLISRKPR